MTVQLVGVSVVLPGPQSSVQVWSSSLGHGTGQDSGRNDKDDQKRAEASKHGITDYAGTLQPEKDIIQGNVAVVCKIMCNTGRVGG